MNLRQQVLSAKSKLETMVVPDLGDITVYIRRMSGAERGECFLAAQKAETEPYLFYMTMVALCLCDETGKRLFERPDDVKDMDGGAIRNIADFAMQVNALSREGKEQARKNS